MRQRRRIDEPGQRARARRHVPAGSRGSRRDGGQAMLGVIPMVLALVAAAVLVLPRLGDAVGSRTHQRTAADAAALAAGTAYRDELKQRWADVLSAPPGTDVLRLHDLLTLDAVRFAADAAQVQADRFADRNDADLVEFDVATDGTGITYHVRTRSRQPIYDSGGQYAYAEATSRVELAAGLCYVDGGHRFGVRLFGVCTGLGSLPTPSPTPSPTSSPTSGTSAPTPSPSPPRPTPTLPPGLGTLLVKVGLIA